MSKWIQSETQPEYIEKTATLGAVKIIILRPKLSEAEATKAKEKACVVLENVIREHYITRTRKEEEQWART